MTSIPVAWTPPTRGTLVVPIVVAPIRSIRDLDACKGKVTGKIVLISYPDEAKDGTTAPFKRYDEAELGKLSTYDQPHYDPDQSFDLYKKYFELARDIDRFMTAESDEPLPRNVLPKQPMATDPFRYREPAKE